MKCSTYVFGAALLAAAANAAAIPDSSETSGVSGPSLTTFQKTKDVGDIFSASVRKQPQVTPQETPTIAKGDNANDITIVNPVPPRESRPSAEVSGPRDLSYLIPEDVTLYRTRPINVIEQSPYFQAESALHKAKIDYIHHVIDRTNAIWVLENSQPSSFRALKAERGMEEAKAKVHQLMEMVPPDKRIDRGGPIPRCSEDPFDYWPCHYAWDIHPPHGNVDPGSKTKSLTGIENSAKDLMHASSPNTTITISQPTGLVQKRNMQYPPTTGRNLPGHPGSSISYLAPYELEAFNTNPLSPSQQDDLSPEEILLRAAKQKVVRKIVDLTKTAYALNQPTGRMIANSSPLMEFHDDRSAVDSSKAAVIKLAANVPEDKRIEIPIGLVHTADCNPDPWMPFPCSHEWDFCTMEHLDKGYYEKFKGYYNCRIYESGAISKNSPHHSSNAE
jgi:hypothetical protein